ncbi:MAG: hypothetical protein ACTTH6_01855 [Candidatus Altimarinota bacterium]
MTNFGEKQGINGFHKNPQNINRKGRPRKGISAVNAELQKKGYEPAKRSEIEDLYMSLVNLPEAELVKKHNDKKQPMLVRIVIRNMLDKKKSFDIVEKILDRGIGKPTQTQNIEGNTTTTIITDNSALHTLNNLLKSNEGENTQ